MTDPENSEAWCSYLMPDANTLQTLAGFADPVAATLFERITSADAEPTLRTTVDRPRTFDLAHLQDLPPSTLRRCVRMGRTTALRRP